tara:strand:+ start:269 stop:880 length:612 start_codon:yes stop_codon:yes gene_type:complete
MTISNSLDRSNSICEIWCDPPTTATSVEHFDFDVEMVQGLSIFRIRELPIHVFVSNVFVDRVESFGLSGFSFNKVWPIPEGVNWRLQVRHQSEEHKQIKRHTLVLILPVHDTTEENHRIKEFEDTIDKKLQTNYIGKEYYGTYEGHEYLNNEYRMYFTCPDVDKLLYHILNELKKLKWPSKIKVCRRYGRMYEVSAFENISFI